MSRAARRIGLLTGTFDPVHLGHVALARAAQAACALTEVWFLVNPAPDHKQGVSELSDRVAMVRLAVDGEPDMREGEPGPSPGGPVRHTMAHFEMLMGRYPDFEFVFIVGADVLATLGSWDDAESARTVQYAVARRPGVPEPALDASLRVIWFDLGVHTAASSRMVQMELRAGKRPAELDGRVYEYIREQKLYF